MCKRHHIHGKGHTDRPSEPRAYEGDTLRLSDRQAVPPHMPGTRRCGGFPWWMLWLIWPAMGLLKLIIERAAGMIGALGNPLLVAQIIGAVVLIVAGVALLARDNRKETTWRR